MKEGFPQGYYAASVTSPVAYEPLAGRRVCDVCVIGGGFTGLSAALHLAGKGARTVLMEARTIGFGASGRNGGQIHTGYRKEQAALETWLGAQHARDLWSISEEGKALVRSLIAEFGIACDAKSGLIIAAHDSYAQKALAADAEHLHKHYDFALDLLGDDEVARATGAEGYRGGTLDRSGGHLHPLNFASGLARAASARGATICEHSEVRRIEEESGRILVHADRGCLDAGIAILACDASSGAVVPKLGPYIGHVESFIVATEPLGSLGTSIVPSDAAVADTRHVLDYYRKSADGRLLFAGREAYFLLPDDIARIVRPRMIRVFPSVAGKRIEFGWSGTVGITHTRMPHFGRVGPRLLFGHGYSGHGVALSVVGGKILAEAAMGLDERFETLARVPAKQFPGGTLLRKPLMSAGLLWYKLMDAF